ncbi:glycoside hydrolase, family 2 [Clostridiales bacterium oral taxon 876 str. F0540]|nr:glycoside hydrolase, family 2 [Clostridiales bacterium oral taxon 876 str. F0540]
MKKNKCRYYNFNYKKGGEGLISLDGKWKMKKTVDNQWINAVVPGSVFNDLLNADLIEDPFYRDNENKVLKEADFDYEYVREFWVSEEILNEDKVLLCCEGLDTLSKIEINDKLIAETDNMHRSYEFDIKNILKAGSNKIHLVFYSPTKYIGKCFSEKRIWGANAMDGFPYLRKSHHMFGWDWGPRVPDMGIWRNIYIKSYSVGRLEDVYVTQKHNENKVELDIRIAHSNLSNKNLIISTKVTNPTGESFEKNIQAEELENHINANIDNPKLWWPNGYGEQPLYKVEVSLIDGSKVLDLKEFNIGLRTVTVKREKDQWGESFEFNINGISIFAMGADYIPEDNILARCSKERTERLIRDCIAANMNCIRVWGGGYYAEDYFYDLCDKFGLIVWQDFMFACADYDLSKEFEENITAELEDNIKRIRHHACIGLYTGNNENESAVKFWGIPKRETTEEEYIKQYEVLFPELIKKYDPNTFYWPSSPSKLGSFKELDNDNMGDAHYWEVWHGLKPFTEYRKHYFRFVSEFGFEAFPGIKTIKSFTLPEDRNPFSYVMENHQKHEGGNGKIIYYISEYLKYPNGLENMLYASQITQAEAIKYGVEHWRRNRGRCMGAIYWQLNDCWPVASWASIDYYGRWKALHYFAKKFFAPVLLSANEEGTKVELHVSNETLNTFAGKVTWRLRDNFRIIEEDSKEVSINALETKLVEKLDFKDRIVTTEDARKLYVEYVLESEGKILSSGTVLFVRPKHFEFLNPEIEWNISEDDNSFIIELVSKKFTKYVYMDLEKEDCIFEDNFFDLTGNERRIIKVDKNSLSNEISLNEFKNQLEIKSIFDFEN